MSNDNLLESSDRTQKKAINLVFGSGGSKAILAGVGAILAIKEADLNIATIGGVSGGSIPAYLFASGMAVRPMVHEVLTVDFMSMVRPKTGLFRRLWALLNKQHHEKRRTREGVYTWYDLKAHFDMLSNDQWPERLYLIACCDHGQIIFDGQGVTKYKDIGGKEILDPEAESVGLAISASCAVPGIIDLVPYNGEWLFDGALGTDGVCPVAPVTRHYRQPQSTVVAFDVGEDPIKSARWFRLWWQLSCGRGDDTCGPFYGSHPDESQGRIIINPPPIRGYHALKFNLNRNQKWVAIITGFMATVDRLEKAGLINDGEQIKLFNQHDACKELLDGKLTGLKFTRAVEKIFFGEPLLMQLNKKKK
ncbi:MAG: patatin-like phospholipase family protein [Cyanobacteria bacterium SZAS TMP-1]|nr:patatin-like phospholipase family protein [Cyanobacteria bacterium SZAS TMP-1]